VFVRITWQIFLTTTFALSTALLAGCAQSATVVEPLPGLTDKSLIPAEVENRAEEVRQDPVAYLREVAANTRRLDQYKLRFTRYERRGFFRTMHGPEEIRCWFRRQPFSVRMKWLDEDIKYGESVYVKGEQDDKVRFVTRWWSPPLLPPPRVNRVDLQTPVKFGESQRPLTDFGLERMMERTLASIEGAGQDIVVTYEGVQTLPDGGPTVHAIHLEYPKTYHRVPVQDLFIDVASDLPAGTILKFPSGKIDAAYYYNDLQTDVRLQDTDFMLAAELQEEPESSGQPKSTSP
jgi:hypothetical protein